MQNNVFERFKKDCEAGNFAMHTELSILQYLVERYNLISVANYAKKHKISHTAADKRIKSGKVMYLLIEKYKFIVNE
jgi:hypothetical protein